MVALFHEPGAHFIIYSPDHPTGVSCNHHSAPGRL
jgi:hypothetical protein